MTDAPDKRCSPHGWTLDTLEKYLSDQHQSLKENVREQDDRNRERFAAAKEAVNAALAAADKALQKAETASEKRFEGVNEFRATLADQASTLMPRAEYNAQHIALIEKVDDAVRRISRIETGASVKQEVHTTSVASIVAMVSVGYGVIASIGVVLTLLLRQHGG